MTYTHQVQLLLDRVALLRWKHSDVLRDPRYQFNLFSMLREPQDEVNLHSRFLAELLDPKGTHCQGDAFLRLFLEHLGIDGFPSQDAEVEREYHGIDIFVGSGNYAVIIENKIYASDQDRQLQRYHRAASRRGFNHISIVYLTLHGDQPSKQTLGTLVDRVDKIIHCVSYEQDIHAWLDECVNSAARYPVVRETIDQYQRLIEVLTGHSLSKGYTMEVRDLLMDEKNIALAVDIAQALVEAKIEIQFAFWKELEHSLRQQGLTTADGRDSYRKYSRTKVRRYYERGQRKYGIMLKLDDLAGNAQLLFYIQVDWNLYYGFVVLRDDNRRIAQEAQFDHLAQLCVQVDHSFKRTAYWLGWRFPCHRINFKDFNDTNAFALADPANRREYIDELVSEIQAVIGDFMLRYGSGSLEAED